MWVAKAFDEWQLFHRHNILQSIVDHSEEKIVVPILDLLVQYFLKLKKKNKELYTF